MKQILMLLIVVCFLVGCDTEKTSEIEHTVIDNIEVDEISTPVDPTEELVEEEFVDYKEISESFELPINGASGYATVRINLRQDQNGDSPILTIINTGEPFTILEEVGEKWMVLYNEMTGYVEHRFCLINLPDVIPSIIYKNTNSYESLLKASEYDIPNITGEMLYDAYLYNERFEEYQYIMPVLYATAKKLDQLQRLALLDNNTLIIYEAFRSRETQKKIVDNLWQLIHSELIVEERLTKNGWSLDWFVNTGVSNHQRGIAIDASLGKVDKIENKYMDSYIYQVVTAYTEYEMPTIIHDLSLEAVTFKQPVASRSKTEWINAELSDLMNEQAKLLQYYFTSVGFTPLASEWWHFNDLDSYDFMKSIGNHGEYSIESLKSKTPSAN